MTDDRETDHAAEKCVGIGGFAVALQGAISPNNTSVVKTSTDHTCHMSADSSWSNVGPVHHGCNNARPTRTDGICLSRRNTFPSLPTHALDLHVIHCPASAHDQSHDD